MLASEFTRQYLDLFFRLQQMQWENYAEGANHDLNLMDAEIYRLLQVDVDISDFSSREQQVYRAIVTRGLVDKHPDVASLRNQLDDWDYYLAGLEDISDRQEQRVQMSVKMRPDVIRLMQLRDQLAREYGFSSYVDLVLAAEDLDRASVVEEVIAYLEQHLPRARQLATKHRLRWSTWFADLSAIAGERLSVSPLELTEQLLDQLGLPGSLEKLTLVCREQRISGYAGVLQPGVDVRILLGSLLSVEGVRTLCHELGHALTHLYNGAHGLLQTWTASYDEAMAVLLEQIGISLLLDGGQLQTVLDISLLENVRCAISFLFELELWQNRSNAEELYQKHYSRMGIDLPNPAVWASDSFRSIDPVYIHNYVLGAVVAERVLPRLPASPRDIGQWLQDKLYKDGRARPLYQKLAEIGQRR